MTSVWNTPPLIVAGISIDVHQSLSLTQTYEVVGGQATRRMASGLAIRQTYWLRLKSTISGQGILPPGLDAIDNTQPQEVSCAVKRSITSTSNTILLPSARRTDSLATPEGFANVNGIWKRTSIAIDGNNIATLTAINGASAYMVQYFPKITGFLDIKTSTERTASQMSWEITIEEV